MASTRPRLTRRHRRTRHVVTGADSRSSPPSSTLDQPRPRHCHRWPMAAHLDHDRSASVVGRGYVPAETQQASLEATPSASSTSTRCSRRFVAAPSSNVADARVGQRTDYDKPWCLEIETNGAVEPRRTPSSRLPNIINQHMNPFLSPGRRCRGRGRRGYFDLRAGGDQASNVELDKQHRRSGPVGSLVQLPEARRHPLGASARLTSAENDLLNIRNFGVEVYRRGQGQACSRWVISLKLVAAG